jgi:hypothetical protein
MIEESQKFWDVLDGEITAKEFEKETTRIRASFEKFKKNPRKHINRGIFFCVIGVLVLIGGMFYPFFVPVADLEMLIRVVFFSAFPFFAIGIISLTSGQAAKKQMTKLLFAEKNGWLFDAHDNRDRLNQLQTKFKTLNKGTDTGITEQYWGHTTINGKHFDFYTALHSYSIRTGKHEQNYTNTIMIFKLPQTIQNPFYVVESSAGIFSAKDVELESVEFNKKYVVNFSKKNSGSPSEIMHIITPAVQNKFLELAKKFDYFTADFSGDAVLFSIGSDLLDTFEPDILGTFELNPAHEAEIKNNLKQLFDTAGEILKYID